MKPYYEDSHVTILHGDCREILPHLDAAAVHTCVTSPPYFGLRDYQGEKQIGLEPTPAAYVAEMTGVFEEVRRVLRQDGTTWLNLGDSYANNPSTSAILRIEQGNGGGVFRIPDEKHVQARRQDANRLTAMKRGGLKHKDLIGIPWRVAFALQDAGWYLRSDIIWAKSNQMPESVTDRPTKAHEYLFLLAKAARYYYDAAAIAEPSIKTDVRETTFKRTSGKRVDLSIPGHADAPHREDRPDTLPQATRNRRSVWTVNTQPYAGAHFAVFPEKLIEPCILAGCPVGGTVLDPFGGSGTTARVAKRLGRRCILIEQNEQYCEMAAASLGQGVFDLEVA